MSEIENILLVGGAETGKTNYLSRLWLAMLEGNGRLIKDVLPDELDYLESGTRKLLRGEFAGHTPRDSFNKIEIPFQLKSHNKKGRLILPDVSGEDCTKIYSDRSWNMEWEECIPNCTGCLLFIREGVLSAPLSWVDAQRIVVEAKGSKHGTVALGSNPSIDKYTPTQTILVEWLQFISAALREKRGHDFVPRIAIIVAAWDELGEELAEEGPSSFLKLHTPLLHQYINTNGSRLLSKAFGVSVVGGDLAQDNEFKKKYLQQMKPNESGYVIYEEESSLKKSSDITIPVAWLLSDTGHY